jgi:hypothetical protein
VSEALKCQLLAGAPVLAVLLLLLQPFLSHPDAVDMYLRTTLEVVGTQDRISQRVEGEAEAMAMHADIARHFLHRSQVVVLVVLYPDYILTVLLMRFSWQVAGGAGDAATAIRGAGNFLLP